MHQFVPSAGTVRGVRSARQNLTDGTVVFSLYTRTALNFIGPEARIDVGCTILSEYMTLNLNADQRQPFRPYRPGRFLDSPQPDTVIQPDVWMDVRFQMEVYSAEHQLKLQSTPISFRRTDTGFHSFPKNQEYPMELASPIRPPRWIDNKMEMNARVKAPHELVDFVVQLRLTSIEPSRRAEVISRFVASYFVNFRTTDRTEPLIAVYAKCSSWEPDPHTHGDVLIVPRRANTAGCLILAVDGNPLPHVTMHELTGDSVGEAVMPLYPEHWTETSDMKVYNTPTLAIGT